MQLIPIETPIIEQGARLTDILLNAVEESGETLREGDILAIADKVVAVSEGRVRSLEGIRPSPKARELGVRYGLDPRYVELILEEADRVYGGAWRALLTVKDGIPIANAGIDRKNSPPGSATLWPLRPNEKAREIGSVMKKRTGVGVGVILVDSKVNPLRLGTSGFALGFSGFRSVRDLRGKLDLFGKPLVITRVNIADGLAAAAHLLMGETTERRPLVIIRDAPVEVSGDGDEGEVKIEPDECLFFSNLFGRDQSGRMP